MKPGPSLSLEAVVDEPLRFDFEVPFTVEKLAREPLVAVSPAHIEGEVSRVEGGYSLSARLSWEGKLECSRCLAHYGFTHEEEFSLLLYHRRPVAESELSLGAYPDRHPDEAAVPRGLPRPLPALRGRSERVGMPLRSRGHRSALESAPAPEERIGTTHAQPEAPPQQGPPRQEARSRRARPPRALRVSELPRAQSASSRLPPLRVLQREAADQRLTPALRNQRAATV